MSVAVCWKIYNTITIVEMKKKKKEAATQNKTLKLVGRQNER